MHGHVLTTHGHCTSNRKQNTSVKELETTIMSDSANHMINISDDDVNKHQLIQNLSGSVLKFSQLRYLLRFEHS